MIPIDENPVHGHPRTFGSHVTVRPPALLTDRPSAPQAYQSKITQSTGIAQCFIWKEIAQPPGLLERKNNNKAVSSLTFFFMFILKWITKKELERVIENKGDEFRRKKILKIQSGGKKMRDLSFIRGGEGWCKWREGHYILCSQKGEGHQKF